jgi:hypothetical protein
MVHPIHHLQQQHHCKKTSTRQLLALCLGVAIGFSISTFLCSWSLSIAATPHSENNGDPNHGVTPVLQQHERIAKSQHRQPHNNHNATSTTADHTPKHIQPFKTKHNDNNININNTSPDIHAWPYWPAGVPLPCYYAPDKVKEERARVMRKRGLLFLKPVKVGSSTALGVQLRIAEHEAVRQHKNFTRCTATHGHAKAHYFKGRIQHESFLWSMVRDPTRRTVSEFFHFIVSRDKVEPTCQNFIEHVRGGKVNARDYYFYDHDVTIMDRSHKGGGTPEVVNRILQSFDFIGITERFDESMVVLQLLLHLPTADVLYLNAKRAGNYDDGGHKNLCHYIVPSFITPGMQAFFDSPEWQQGYVEKDYILYHAVNASMDATIDDTIGREVFDAALQKFRYAQRIVDEECADQGRFPCTPDGVKISNEKNDCYHKDSGCGKTCIDRVVKERGL